jgi:hypothetical protein
MRSGEAGGGSIRVDSHSFFGCTPHPLAFSKTFGITVLAKNPSQNTFFKELRN